VPLVGDADPFCSRVAASLEGLPEDALAERPAVRQDGRALDPSSSIVRHLGALARQIEDAELKLRTGRLGRGGSCFGEQPRTERAFPQDRANAEEARRQSIVDASRVNPFRRLRWG
jgi:hypothetical protein